MRTRLNRTASSGLVFLFSLFPGAGHMYMGLMRRGTEIMISFFGAIFIVSSILNFAEIGIPITIVIYFYSIFDAYHLAKAIARGEDVQDESFINLGNFTPNGYHIGIGILVIGFFFLFDRLSANDLIPYKVYYGIKRTLSPLVLIGLGLYFILRTRQTAQRPKENQDIKP